MALTVLGGRLRRNHWTTPLGLGWAGQTIYVDFAMVITTAYIRVARWCIFKPKIQIWVIFGGYCNGRCVYIFGTFGLFYSLSGYFMDIW
jgi:hypothetical protein